MKRFEEVYFLAPVMRPGDKDRAFTRRIVSSDGFKIAMYEGWQHLLYVKHVESEETFAYSMSAVANLKPAQK